jgi:hypothetical protein
MFAVAATEQQNTTRGDQINAPANATALVK